MLLAKSVLQIDQFIFRLFKFNLFKFNLFSSAKVAELFTIIGQRKRTTF